MDPVTTEYDELRKRQLAKVLQNVSPQDQLSLASFTLDNQMVIRQDPYYSRVRFPFTGPTGNVITLPAGSVSVAFQYGRTDPLTAGGFPSSLGNATPVDTNLNNKGETNNAEVFVMMGMGILLDPRSDPFLAQQCIPEIYVSAGFNGNTTDYKWGTIDMWPGGGGLIASGLSQTILPNAGDTLAVTPPSPSNGLQGALNYRPFDEPIVWYPKGGGGSDSNFAINFTNPRAVSVTLPASRVAGAATQTIVAYTQPTAGNPGTYVDAKVCLFGYQIGPRSKNR